MKADRFISPSSSNMNSNTISAVIIVIALIFFLSALLHLLIRFLLTPRSTLPHTSQDTATALQGRLQTLFNLHDSGVDQSFIDALPVFHYKTIVGRNHDPFDCAVCLFEFDADDELRLLPKCSHAFHVDCIDTWLLSHSTCPLCRSNLLFDLTASCSPVVLVLDSGSESSRDIPMENGNMERSDSHIGSGRFDGGSGTGECKAETEAEERVVWVKLGKLKSIDACEGNSSSNNMKEKKKKVNGEARRCASMGSLEYVMPSEAFLQVPVRMKKHPLLPLGLRQGPEKSRREIALEAWKGIGREGDEDGRRGKRQKESLSVSRIWQRDSKKMRRCEEGWSFRSATGEEAWDGGTQTLSFATRNLFWKQHRVANHDIL